MTRKDTKPTLSLDATRKDASLATLDAHAAMQSELPTEDGSRADAIRGFVGTVKPVTFYESDGSSGDDTQSPPPIWDLEPYRYQLDPDEPRPDTITTPASGARLSSTC